MPDSQRPFNQHRELGRGRRNDVEHLQLEHPARLNERDVVEQSFHHYGLAQMLHGDPGHGRGVQHVDGVIVNEHRVGGQRQHLVGDDPAEQLLAVLFGDLDHGELIPISQDIMVASRVGLLSPDLPIDV